MLRVFDPLDRKVLRDLWRTRGQALAISLVIASGIALYVLSNGMVGSLDETRRAYYERYRFADIFAPVTRAPEALVEDLSRLPGVLAAEGRISAGILIDVPGVNEPIRGQAVSLPDFREPKLNRVFLRKGRMLEPLREDEILLSDKFAEAHGLTTGDMISATMYGAKRTFRIVGLALSPEYVYTLAPGEFVPDDARFGIFWMGQEALASAFDLDGAFNNAVLSLGPGANQQEVIDAVDALLKPYGGTGAFSREDQISNKFVTSELDQIAAMGGILPPIFLAVAAFLLNIVVSRMIELEREQIGLLKAFGYSSFTIAAHYAKYVLTMALGGGIIGCAVGIWLGRGMAELYLQFFNFPFLIFDPSSRVLATGILVGLAAGGVGIYFAIRRILALSPAVAMRPPVPMDYTGALGEPAWMKRTIDQPTRMIIRRIVRQPVRAVLSILGITAATALLIVGRFNIDASAVMLDINFSIANRQDLTVTFVEPRAARTIHDLSALPGVIATEPYRAVPVRLVNGTHEKLQSITGLPDNPALSRPITKDLNQIPLPPDGLLISTSLARELRVGPGDRLTVEVLEGRQPTVTLPVTGIAEAFIGTPAYMRIAPLNRALGEGPLISGAYLQVDEGRLDETYARIKDMPLVAGVAVQDATRASFQKLLDENSGTITFINTIFAALIAIGVVYNGARVALSERARELASLRVLGFTRGETSYVLLGELALLTVIALPLGLVVGYGLAWYLVQALSSDLYSIPMVVTPATFGYAVLVVVLASLATGALVNRDVRRLDLISALKTRE